MQVVEPPARVRPTGRQHDVAAGGQSFEAGVAIDLQETLEAFEVSGGPFSLAIGTVEVDG